MSVVVAIVGCVSSSGYNCDVTAGDYWGQLLSASARRRCWVRAADARHAAAAVAMGHLLAAVAVAPTTTVKQECRVKRIPAISLEQQQLDSILGYFVYTLMSTRSSLGVNIPKCT